MAINKLPESVRSFLRTGLVVTSPAQTIVELVLNSIDAGATSISVRVDLQNFRLEVSDNGCGMEMEDIDRVGTRYMTSKCHSLQDLQSRLNHFGFRGEALASLREVTGFLTIESRPHSSELTYCKTFIRGKPYRAAVSEKKQKSSGTTVTAVEFMYNLPVRRKRIKEAIDLEEIKFQLECIAVIHPQISIGLRNDVTSKTIMQSHKNSSIVQAFSQLFGEKIASNLAPVSHELSGFKLIGHIGKLSHTQRHLQFIYVNRRLVLKTKLHKLVNALLAKSYILRPNGPWKNSPITKNVTSAFWLTFPPREKRNKFAIFILNIECAPASYDISFEPKKTLVEFVDWDLVLKLIDEGVRKFLAQETIGIVDDSPPITKVRNHSQLSVIREMEELEKECTLATVNLKDCFERSDHLSNCVVADKMRDTSITVQGVHGLPARRRKLMPEKNTEVCTLSDQQQEASNHLNKCSTLNVTLADNSVCLSENPFPTISNHSDAAEKRAERECVDVNCCSEVRDSFLPPPSKIPKRNLTGKVLPVESTDSEDPTAATRQQCKNIRLHAAGQKRKSVEAYKNLNMTKGKLKNFSFSLRKKNVFAVKRTSENFEVQQNVLAQKCVTKKIVTDALNNFSYCTPNDRHLKSKQSEDFCMEAIASTQTNLSGDCRSGVEFSSTAPVSKKLPRVSIHKPPVLSKSTQTENNGSEVSWSTVKDDFPSAVHTRDIGINAPCDTNNSFLECKLISNMQTKTNSEQSFQKTEVVGCTHPEASLESGRIILNDSTVNKIISVKDANLPKSCLKNNVLQNEAFCNKSTYVSKSVSFHTNPTCSITLKTQKSMAQNNRILCTENAQKGNQPSRTGNQKFYMTSTDFLNSFKALQSKSVSVVNDICKPKEIYKNQSAVLIKNRTCENTSGLCVESNSHSFGSSSNKNNNDNGNFSELGPNSETPGMKLGVLDINKSSSSLSDIILDVHDIVNKSPIIQRKGSSIEMETQIKCSTVESINSSRSSEASDLSICVVAVPDVSTDSENSLTGSEPLKNLNTHNETNKKEMYKCSTFEEDNETTNVLRISCHFSSCSATKIQTEEMIVLTGSSSNECSDRVASSSSLSDSKINHRLNKTAACSENECIPTSDLPSCNVRIDVPDSCRSSTEDSIPCGQVCISPPHASGSPSCSCDVSVNENGGVNLSSFVHGHHSTGCNTELHSPYFSFNEIGTVKFHSSSSLSSKANGNKHGGTIVNLCSDEGESCNKRIVKRSVNVENNSSEEKSSNVDMFLSPKRTKKTEDDDLKSYCNDTNALQNVHSVTDENYECSSNDKTVDEKNWQSQIITTLELSGDKVEVLVDKSDVVINNDLGYKPLNKNKNIAEAQISQNCYVDEVHDTEHNGKDCGVGTTDRNSLTASVSSQVLMEVADIAVQNINSSFEDPGEIQTFYNTSKTNGKSTCASERQLDLQNISPGNVSRFDSWVESVDANGRKFYLHSRSGITSYKQPVPAQEQVTFRMAERYEFLPKGMSPILQVPTGKNSEARCLTPESREMLTEVLSEGGHLQDELATVKWGTSTGEKSGTTCTDLLDQLMCSADRRVEYCEQNVPNTAANDKNAIKIYKAIFPYSLTKEALVATRVLRQVDKKLILAVTTLDKTKPPHLLVLFDQHAVHERIRVEQLFRDYRVEGSITHFRFTDAEPNITMDLSAQEVRILSSFEDEFQQAGLYYNVLSDTQIQVTKIPTCLHEREKREFKHGTSVLKKFLESLIREQVDFLIQTRGVACSMPPTLRDIINSEACKGALKFGHELTTEECQVLVKHLAQCNMPFHCAHGRPSVIPIADLSLISQQQKFEKPRLWNLKNVTTI